MAAELERPRFPSRAILAWLTLTANITAIGSLFGLSTAAKLILVGIEVLGFVAISAFYLGQLRLWHVARTNHAQRPRREADPSRARSRHRVREAA